jgi:glycosyltransferase involved in cell wall biosynthesis
MKKVLWLASWYPNESDPFNGDFIKRQAEAVSIYQPLNVLWVGKYAPTYFPEKAEHLIRESGATNLREYIVYYPGSGKGNSVFSKIQSLFHYFKKNREIIQHLRKKNEFPEIVHVQVAMKAGLIALYLKWKYKIPYVLTEHWSGYYAMAKDSLFRKSFLTRFLTRIIIKKADLLLPVSDNLGRQINKFWAKVPFQKIPNVVNTKLFYPAEKKTLHPFRFIHISSLLYPKNPEGIIHAFIHMLYLRFDVELVLVGPLNPSVNKLLTDEVMATEKIRTTGEISYEEVGRELRNADALVMFSFYENMPCVILEALCTGVPVIASDVGGIREVIYPENGILVEAGKEVRLFKAMKEMLENYDYYEKEDISRFATGQFSYETIGKRILHVYDEVLNNGQR